MQCYVAGHQQHRNTLLRTYMTFAVVIGVCLAALSPSWQGWEVLFISISLPGNWGRDEVKWSASIPAHVSNV